MSAWNLWFQCCTNVSGKQSHCKPSLSTVDDLFTPLMCFRIKRERIFFWEWTPWVCTSTSRTTGWHPNVPSRGMRSEIFPTATRRWETVYFSSVWWLLGRTKTIIERLVFCKKYCLLNVQFTIKPLDKKTKVFKFNSSRLRVNKLVSCAGTDMWQQQLIAALLAWT